MNLYLAFDIVCTFLGAYLIINAQKNLIPNNDKVRIKRSKYRLNTFSIAITLTNHPCYAKPLTISPNAPAHAFKGLTIIGQVHTRQH
jgi:K+-transporting ATPase A subunit